MVAMLEGVRVLEVAQFVFMPSAGAILAEWGADVLKVEHPVQFDGVPADVIRAPQTAEHTESVLLEMGMDWDAIAALKAAGIVS